VVPQFLEQKFLSGHQRVFDVDDNDYIAILDVGCIVFVVRRGSASDLGCYSVYHSAQRLHGTKGT
jgi:hypothetical protein